MCIGLDEILLGAGFFGEGRVYDGSTLVQKTHHTSVIMMDEELYDEEWRKDHIRTFGGRGILIIRNPYDAILSYWNFLHANSPTAIPRDQKSSFRRFVNFCMDKWEEVTRDWLTMSEDCYVIIYEVSLGKKIITFVCVISLFN